MSGSARTVDYIFRLIDQFGPVAAQLARSAQNAERTIAGMGRASVAVEKAQRGAANAIAAMNQRTLAANPALKNATEQLRAYGAAGERAAAQVRTLAQAQTQLTKLEKDAALQRKFNGGSGPMSRGDYRDRAIGHAGAAVMAGYVSSTISQGVQEFIGSAANIDTIKRKMTMALGGDSAIVEKAYTKASELSEKYSNTTIAENLHIIDDLRANLPEKMEKIITETTEPFIKLHGFFKAYEGGKHANVGHDALKDIGTAIRSGELAGNLTGEQIGNYASSIAAARVWFGEKYKVGENFTAQKAAAVAYNAADATFQQVYFPVLVQSLGQRAGTGLSTLYNKLVAGTRVLQSSAEKFREIGMVDMTNVKLDKHGKIDKSSLVGNNWLVGGDSIGRNIPDWMMTTLLPHLSGHVKGLDGQGFSKAWQEHDTDKLVHLTQNIDRASLSRKLSALGYDKTAVMEMEEIIFRAASMSRDLLGIKNQLGDFEKYKSFDKTNQSVAAQGLNLMSALGGPMVQPYIDRMNAWAESLNWASKAVSNFSKANPKLAGAAGTVGVYGLGALASVAMAASVGFGLAAVRNGLGFLLTRGALTGGGAMMAAPLMMGLGGAGGLAAAGTAGAVVARTGIMTRVLGGLVSALTFGAIGINKFHLAANGMGEGLALAGRVLRTTVLGVGLGVAWYNRDKLKNIGSYVSTLFSDINGLYDSIYKHTLGSRQSKKSFKKLAKDMGLDLDLPAVPDVLDAPNQLMNWATRSLRDSGYMSLLRYQVKEDQFRLPYGERPELAGMVSKMGGRGRIDGDNASDFAGQQASYLKSLNVGDMNSYGGYAGADKYVPPDMPSTRGTTTAGYFMPPDLNLVPTSERNKEISVQSFVNISVPPSVPIQVTVSGTINGTVTGSGAGAIQMKADAPRGESAPADTSAMMSP